ncbi:MAG TPA: Crp/Fnr family transcriptional regulator [Agitococcus sp.]|nr:Crp/Fnr family transcriptional regulator [Agitococcus sp.]
MSAHRYAPLLLQGSWFSGISPQLRQSLLDQANVLVFGAGQEIFAYGDEQQGIYAVVDGCVSISRYRPDGKESLLTIIDPANWFGEITLFDKQKRTHRACAVSQATLLYVDGQSLNHLLAQYPHYWQEFGLLLTHKVRFLMDMAEDLAVCSTTQRVAKRLVLIAENYGMWIHQSRRMIDTPQEQLAMMLFMTRQTINQVLKKLARQQLIKLHYGAIEVLDLEGLKKISH